MAISGVMQTLLVCPITTKQFVLQTAQHNKLLEPKSTKHVVRINDGYAPVIVLSEFMI